MRLQSLPTPQLLLDVEIAERNAARMRAQAARLGLHLRPHIKTAKSIEVAELMLGDLARRIAVSTPREAEYFAERGYTDITYAVGIVPARFARLAALRLAGVEVRLVSDNLEMVQALDQYTRSVGVDFPVQLELDVGAGRGGLPPDSAELQILAEAVARSPALRLDGVLAHAGQSYHCHSWDELRAVAHCEVSGARLASARLREAGHEAPVVSIGSSPSAWALETVDGVTELRSGVYIFNDRDQLNLGICGREDLALTVLATVIGHNRKAGALLIDAGSLALSPDRGLSETSDGTLGEICEVASLDPIPGVALIGLNQEHGIARVTDCAAYAAAPVGSQVRVLPNHACITAAAHQRYVLLKGGEPIGHWARVNGW